MDVPTLTLIASALTCIATVVLVILTAILIRTTHILSNRTDHLAKVQIKPKVVLDNDPQITESGNLAIGVINRGMGGALGTKLYLSYGGSAEVQAEPYSGVNLDILGRASFWVAGVVKGYSINQLRITYTDIEGTTYEEKYTDIRRILTA